MNIIERPVYLNKLISKMDNGMIKVITGIRRSGKSVLLFELFYQHLLSVGVPDDSIIKIALDDPENAAFLDPEVLYRYLSEKTQDKSRQYYILLDEVQFVISREELKNKDAYIRLYGILNGLLRKQNVDVWINTVCIILMMVVMSIWDEEILFLAMFALYMLVLMIGLAVFCTRNIAIERRYRKGTVPFFIKFRNLYKGYQ